MEQIIEASQATISQAVITINAVRIGKKQMTQSVFKQLPIWMEDCDDVGFDENDYIYEDDDGTESLVRIWGHVNYCPDKACPCRSTHRHIIVIHNNYLYRSLIYEWLYSPRYEGSYFYMPGVAIDRGKCHFTTNKELVIRHNRFYNRIISTNNQLFIAV